MTDSVRLVRTEYASDLCEPRPACQRRSGELAEGWEAREVELSLNGIYLSLKNRVCASDRQDWAPGATVMKTSDADIIQRLGRSNLYTEFKKAFGVSTGLPLTLRPLEFWELAHCGQPYESPFCALLEQTNRGCSGSLEAEQRAVDAARNRSATVRCFADLCHTAVAVKLGEHTIGYLVTGQAALDLPSKERFEAVARQLTEKGVLIGRKRLLHAYYHSKVLSPEQYAGLIRCWKSLANSFPALPID
jgi:hypothetical protein